MGLKSLDRLSGYYTPYLLEHIYFRSTDIERLLSIREEIFFFPLMSHKSTFRNDEFFGNLSERDK